MQLSKPVVSLSYLGRDIDVATRLRRSGADLLILLHGLGCSKESFDGAFAAVGLRDYTICAVDFPGHGESSRGLPGEFYTLESYADITGQVISHLMGRGVPRFNRVCVAGHSMGGAVAVLLAEKERCIACRVSIDGNLVAEDCGLVSRGIAEQSPERFVDQGFNEFHASLRNSAEPDSQAWASWCARTAPDAMHTAARSLVEWSDSGELLKRFNVLKKKAFLYGKRDDKQYLLPRIEGAMISAVPRAGHFMMVDNQNKFYRILSHSLDPAHHLIQRSVAADRTPSSRSFRKLVPIRSK